MNEGRYARVDMKEGETLLTTFATSRALAQSAGVLKGIVGSLVPRLSSHSMSWECRSGYSRLKSHRSGGLLSAPVNSFMLAIVSINIGYIHHFGCSRGGCFLGSLR